MAPLPDTVARYRPSAAVIDLGALAANIRLLAGRAAPARFCAVVKADAYGHGAVPVARAAVAAGADCLGVALVEEGAELRGSGISTPILLLSEQPRGSEAHLVDLDLEATVYSIDAARALDRAAAVTGRTARVHLKINTGMHRVGAEPAEAVQIAKHIDASGNLELAGTWTHFAVADQPDDAFTRVQADVFDGVVSQIADSGIDPGMRHAANSAALLVDPQRYRYDMVRVGISIYGVSPGPALDDVCDRWPVMSLRSRVGHVRRVAPGTRVSYGLRYEAERTTWLGTVPLGYADGVRRGLSGSVDVLVEGVRRPVAGTITMDQIVVDLGRSPVDDGAEVVLIGRQRECEITAAEWAEMLETIGYEITCAIGARVPREYIGGA